MNSFTASVLMWSLALSASAQAPSSKGVNFYSLDREVRLGQQESDDLARTLPVVHDATLDAYVAKLGSELAKNADHQFAYSFTVYEDRKSLAVQSVGIAMPADAFRGQPTEPIALPGGPILVPLSLLANAQNEAEFAFQLTHAMAHIALRHSTRQATRGELANIANNQLKGSQVSNQVMQIGFVTFTRRFELESDTVAIGILASAGYDPEAVARHLSHSTVDPTQMSELFSAHPTGARRLQAVNAAREELPSRIYSAATGEFDRIHALAASVR
jgi:beta-barrel assembly-enhancing protease